MPERFERRRNTMSLIGVGLLMIALSSCRTMSDGSAAIDSSSEAEVTFTSQGIELRGTLLKPSRVAAAVVFVHGSGNSDRQNPWYRRVAERLAEQNIAVLLPDKRGSGESGGDWKTATFADLAEDAIAGVEELRRHVGDVPTGLVAASQGGWVASLAARRSRDIDFAVTMSSPMTTLEKQQRSLIEQMLNAAAVPEPIREQVWGFFALSARYLRTGEGWSEYAAARKQFMEGPLSAVVKDTPSEPDDWQWSWGKPIFDFDPIPVWNEAGKPLLAVFGSADPNVPVEMSVENLRKHVPSAEVIVVEGSSHDLGIREGDEAGQALVDRIAQWMKRRR